MPLPCAVATMTGFASVPRQLPEARSTPRLPGPRRLRSWVDRAKRRSALSLRRPSRARLEKPSPTRTAAKVQVLPEWERLPLPLAASPRSLPLTPVKEASKVRFASKLPEAEKPKLRLPGRSGRHAAGLMPVALPLTDQLCAGDQASTPLTLACPPNRSTSAG